MFNRRNFTIFSYFILAFLSLCTSNNSDINTLELSLAGIAHNNFADVLRADNDSGKDASDLFAQIMGDEIELKLTDFVASDLEGKMSPAWSTSKSGGLDDDVMRVVRSLSDEREDDQAFLGTNLFSAFRKPCFTKAEIALLQMRRDFELIVPKGFPKHLLTDKKVCALMKYFNRVNDLLTKIRNEDTQYDAQRAFYDTLGAYLRYRVVPVAKLSFYAGQMRFCTVNRIIHLYNECRLALNTNGNGWKLPRKDLIERLRVGEVEPIKPVLYKAAEPNACTLLDLHSINRDADNVGMLVGLPKLEAEDDNGFILNIALPFKKRRIYNLRSSQSAFIVVRFFLVVTRCYEVSGICQNMYNERFKVWIDEELEHHFYDEKFYPGLGGILRVYESLKKPVPNPNEFALAMQEKRGSSLDPNNSDMPALVVNGGNNNIKEIPRADKKPPLEHSIGLVRFGSASNSHSMIDSNSGSNITRTIRKHNKKRDSLEKQPRLKPRKKVHRNKIILANSTHQWTYNSTMPTISSATLPWNLALNYSFNNKTQPKISLVKDKDDDFWACWFNLNKYILYICLLLLSLLILLFLVTVFNLYGVIGCDKDEKCCEKKQKKRIPDSSEQPESEPEPKRNLRKSEEGCCSSLCGDKRNRSRRKKTEEVIVISSHSQSVQPTKEPEECPRKPKRKKSSKRHRSRPRKPSRCSKRRSASSSNSEAKPQIQVKPPPPPQISSPAPASTSESASASSSNLSSLPSENCICDRKKTNYHACYKRV